MPPMPPHVELEAIQKRYGQTQANEAVSLRLMPGEVHALVGENGAGKSTLMSILFGLVQPDRGVIRVAGQPRRWRSPQDAIAAGLGMVHQHFMLLPSMTVLDNVLLGAEPCNAWGFISRAAATRRLQALEAQHGLGLSRQLTQRVQDLSVGERQRVEILKMLFRGASTLILDEPTAALTPAESLQLFNIVRGFRARGHSIVLVTHKLAEVMAISDCVTVMRAGRVVAHWRTADTTVAKIGEAMLGRSLVSCQAAQPPLARKTAGAIRLAVGDLKILGANGRLALQGLDFELREGEIVGLAGVAGNGQQALISALAGLAGLRAVASGSLLLDGRDIAAASVQQRIDAGLAVAPEDRAHAGLAGTASVWANALAGLDAQPRFARRGWLRLAAVRAYAQDLLERHDVRPRGPGVVDQAVGLLSGGNQQKLMLARALERRARVLVVETPTWGVDIGAVQAIHARLREQAAAGCAVLVLSSDLDELRQLCDRLLVINAGRISGGMACDAIDEAQLALWMGGAAAEKAEEKAAA